MTYGLLLCRLHAAPDYMYVYITLIYYHCLLILQVDPSSEDAVLVKALSNEVVSVIRDLVKANPLFREQTQYFTSRVDLGDPFKLADFAASLTTAEGFELQVWG